MTIDKIKPGEKYFSDKVISNARKNYQEFEAKAMILGSYPIKIYLEPTHKCNIKCNICTVNRKNFNHDMPLEIFEKVKTQLFPTAAEVNFYLDGEPLLAENFSYMASACSEYTFLPKINTNGTHMPDHIIDILAEQGFFVNFSIDAASTELFEKIRCGAKFQTVVQNILKLKKKQEVCKNRRAHIRIATTLSLNNIEEAPEIIGFAHNHGIRDVMFNPYNNPKDSANMLMNDPERVMASIEKAMALADTHKIRFSAFKKIGNRIAAHQNNWNDFALPVDDYAPFYLESFNPYEGDCGYPWTNTVIAANGNVLSCCRYQHCMGNISKKYFVDIWNNRKYRGMRLQKNYHKCRGVTCDMHAYSMWNGPTERAFSSENK